MKNDLSEILMRFDFYLISGFSNKDDLFEIILLKQFVVINQGGKISINYETMSTLKSD